MALYSLDGRDEQPSIGSKPHWELFRRYQGSVYHNTIVDALDAYIGQQTIDAAITGREILRSLEQRQPDVAAQCPRELQGGLFGMTLWNLLAEQAEAWAFIAQSSESSEFPHMHYWRRT